MTCQTSVSFRRAARSKPWGTPYSYPTLSRQLRQ